MANKKRKTRAQKEKAAQRRSEGKPSPSGSSAAAPSNSTASTAEKPERGNEKDDRHQERMRTMLISLQVFSGLVVIQLILWGLDYAGVVSLKIL